MNGLIPALIVRYPNDSWVRIGQRFYFYNKGYKNFWGDSYLSLDAVLDAVRHGRNFDDRSML